MEFIIPWLIPYHACLQVLPPYPKYVIRNVEEILNIISGPLSAILQS